MAANRPRQTAHTLDAKACGLVMAAGVTGRPAPDTTPAAYALYADHEVAVALLRAPIEVVRAFANAGVATGRPLIAVAGE